MDDEGSAEISRRLARHVRESFDDSAHSEVLARLKALTDPLGHEPSERVMAAVVLASKGDYQRFLEMINLAEVDWRDVLVAGGLENMDWQAKLTRRLGVA